MACAMFCSSTVLPVRGGDTISARWPLPIGAHDVDHARREILLGRILVLHAQPLVG
jgi:hypothetical protein